MKDVCTVCRQEKEIRKIVSRDFLKGFTVEALEEGIYICDDCDELLNIAMQAAIKLIRKSIRVSLREE